ncbi:hypothetical protein BU15DRAFT_67062 [Melanogaster broomeanus]|nr:hypothetical protein BU15DRAFT_67062 [Melanogaster broomeanus]
MSSCVTLALVLSTFCTASCLEKCPADLYNGSYRDIRDVLSGYNILSMFHSPQHQRTGSRFKLKMNNLTNSTVKLGSYTLTGPVLLGAPVNYGNFTGFDATHGRNTKPLTGLTTWNNVVRIDSVGCRTALTTSTSIASSLIISSETRRPRYVANHQRSAPFVLKSGFKGMCPVGGVDQDWPVLTTEYFRVYKRILVLH